jgi:hypothetical protein
MEDFLSKYSGEQVENLLDQVASSQFITTDELDTALNDKVDKVSGKQLSTEDFTSILKNKLEGLSNYDDTTINNAISGLQSQINTLVSGNASTAIESFNEIIAFLNGITDSQSLDSIIASIEQQIAGKMDKVTLAKVATSGSYSDLTNKPTIPAEQVNADWNATSGKAKILNKPTIPSAVTESTVSGWGFTKNTGTYSKPSTGIPKTDLASAVQTSLGKADTALQSYTEKYKGTVTKVKINGSEKTPDANGLVDLGTIEGGGGSSSGGSGAYAEVNHGTNNTTFVLTPNTFHVWDEVSTLTLTLGTEITGVANEFLFQFTSGSEATSLTLPDDVKWSEELTIEPNMIYQVSILNGLAAVMKWENIKIISFVLSNITLYAEEGMTWSEFIYSEYNTESVSVYGSSVFFRMGLVHLNGIPVNLTDTIIGNSNYYIQSSTGGGGA